MDYGLNVKAFLKRLPCSTMSGHQKFLSVAALIAKGDLTVQVQTNEVQSKWLKSALSVRYNPALYVRAQAAGWVDSIPDKVGTFVLTQTGIDHLLALPTLKTEISTGELRKSGSLVVVNRKATHTFDKYLRSIFASAKTEVLVADAWVDDTTFDNVLDVAPKSIPFRLIYAEARGNFHQRATRFATEFQKFQFKRYKPLHDRFIVVSDKGYMLGPSIKDAASNSPALVVELPAKETRLLRSFFDELWQEAKIVREYPDSSGR